MSIKFEVVESDITCNTFRVIVKQQIPGPTSINYGEPRRILKSAGLGTFGLQNDLAIGAVVEVIGGNVVIDGNVNNKLHIREVALA